jgi:hypothetical protein
LIKLLKRTKEKKILETLLVHAAVYNLQ